MMENFNIFISIYEKICKPSDLIDYCWINHIISNFIGEKPVQIETFYLRKDCVRGQL